jgi:hypothetical protein
LRGRDRAFPDQNILSANISEPRIYQKQAVTHEVASKFRGLMFVSQWIEHAQAVVSATLVYQNHAVASEIFARRWNLTGSCRFHAVVSAALVDLKNSKLDNPPSVRSSLYCRHISVSHWIRFHRAVVSSALVCYQHASARETVRSTNFGMYRGISPRRRFDFPAHKGKCRLVSDSADIHLCTQIQNVCAPQK